MESNKFTKYERARIIGARALQLAMNAPILLKINEEKLRELDYDPLRIAELELDSNVLPITVKRPLPEKKEEDIESIKIFDKESDEEKIKIERKEEGEIMQEGEIMELTNPDEEEEETEEENNE